MRKWTSTALGGAPVYDDDLLDIFNSEIWGAMQAIFSPYDSDTEGVIVSGCVISGSGPYNISAGIVYLNGEFMRINAFTSLSLPFYIQPDTVTTEPRTFADSTVNAVITVKIATVGGSAPGSGQYIAVTSPTDPDDRRWDPASQLDVTNAVASEASARSSAISSEALTRSSGDSAISGGIWTSVSLSASDITSGAGVNPTSIGTSVIEYRIGEKEVFVFIKLRAVTFAAIPNAIRVVMPSAIRSYLSAALGSDDNIVTGSSDNNGGPPNRLAVNGQYNTTNFWIEFLASSYSGNDFIDVTQNNLTCQFFVKV